MLRYLKNPVRKLSDGVFWCYSDALVGVIFVLQKLKVFVVSHHHLGLDLLHHFDHHRDCDQKTSSTQS